VAVAPGSHTSVRPELRPHATYLVLGPATRATSESPLSDTAGAVFAADEAAVAVVEDDEEVDEEVEEEDVGDEVRLVETEAEEVMGCVAATPHTPPLLHAGRPSSISLPLHTRSPATGRGKGKRHSQAPTHSAL
jgi:hypothetical protein